MDVSSYLGGSFLTHTDLLQSSQVWTIREVKEEMVGTDVKVVVYFAEHQKGLGLNRINLRAITQDYGVNTNFWIGKPVELFRDKTQFQGQLVDCVRVRIPPPAAPPAEQPPQQQQPGELEYVPAKDIDAPF
jgi:hypothetical protein